MYLEYINQIMVSSKYVKMSSRGGYLPSTKCSKNGCGMTVGGAVPMLLNKILKDPIKRGGSISKTNQAVGIITTPPPPPTPAVMRGGELLNALSNISFDKNVKKNKRDNIKFIF